MVIECKNCLKKFNLDEHRLRPNGSKVRCTKCGQVFRAFPIFLEKSEQSLLTENEINGKVVYSERNKLGKMKIGLTSIGTSKEISDFVLQLVRYHHYATRPVDKVQGKEKGQPAISCSGCAT